MQPFSRMLVYFAEVARQGSVRKASEALNVSASVIEAMVQGFLPGIIDQMRTDWPGIALEILVLPNEDVAAAVASGDCDAGLLLNPQSSRDITVRAFREVPLGVAMPAGHALAGRSGLRFNQLAGLDVIRPLPPLEIAGQFAALEAASGLQLRTALAANNIGMVRSLVARGAGLSVVSRIDVAAELQQGVIAFVPLAEKPLRPTTLALCHARQGQLSSAARLLMRIAEEREVWDD